MRIESLALVVVALLAGCSVSTTVIPISPEPQRTPVTSEQVAVYQDTSEIKRPFELLAVIQAKGSANYSSREALIQALRERAAQLGADGIVMERIQEPSLVAKAVGEPDRVGSARAITFTVPTASTASPRPSGVLNITSTGTGFFINAQGHLLTNAHVVQDCRSVRTRGSTTPLEIVRVDTENDLALLKRDGGVASVASFREGRGIRPGDAVVAVGFPLTGVLASEANVTTGGVSALAGMGDDFRFLQITAPVQPGNSGGPLLDASGNVVGVVTSKLNALRIARATGDIPQNINFAVNASVARIFLDAVGISYATAPSAAAMGPADIGEKAKAFTVLLECWR